jgi:UDP-N-acetylmuramyl tripeptide synthase
MISIIVGKLAVIACKFLRRSGTNMPGNVAAKIDKQVLKKLSGPFYVIMVTGTNGKTTTTGMISQILSENHVEFVTNKSGANLFGGVTTLFISCVNIFGKCKKPVALIEVDEATIDRVTNYVEPDIMVVTNFFRDQLDRYGELYSTLNKVRSGILKTKKIKLVLNSDDSLCASLGDATDNQKLYFGVEAEALSNTDENNISDASFCIHCKTKYEYSYMVLGHLGDFSCPNCGYCRPLADVKCIEVLDLQSTSSKIRFSIGDNIFAAKINVAGFYNIYNALAAIACAQLMDYPIEKSIASLDKFQNSFGRMENIEVKNKNIRLILAKNPTGFNQILNFLITEKRSVHVAFLINDRVQDGTDVSWLWDVDFESLQKWGKGCL